MPWQPVGWVASREIVEHECRAPQQDSRVSMSGQEEDLSDREGGGQKVDEMRLKLRSWQDGSCTVKPVSLSFRPPPLYLSRRDGCRMDAASLDPIPGMEDLLAPVPPTITGGTSWRQVGRVVL